MKEQKRVLTLNTYEFRLAMYGLIHFRTSCLPKVAILML